MSNRCPLGYLFINFFTCTGVGKIFLQINSAAVAFIDILIAAGEGLIFTSKDRSGITFCVMCQIIPRALVKSETFPIYADR